MFINVLLHSISHTIVSNRQCSKPPVIYINCN